MPQHPAPPTDLGGLVGAYEQTTRAVIDLGQTLSARDFARDTECPGWTVKDQFNNGAWMVLPNIKAGGYTGPLSDVRARQADAVEGAERHHARQVQVPVTVEVSLRQSPHL